MNKKKGAQVSSELESDRAMVAINLTRPDLELLDSLSIVLVSMRSRPSCQFDIPVVMIM